MGAFATTLYCNDGLELGESWEVGAFAIRRYCDDGLELGDSGERAERRVALFMSLGMRAKCIC